MMYSAYKLNKQGDNIQPWCTPFLIWNQSIIPYPVLTVASWPAYRFLKGQVSWSGIPISWRIFHKNFLSRRMVDKCLWPASPRHCEFYWGSCIKGEALQDKRRPYWEPRRQCVAEDSSRRLGNEEDRVEWQMCVNVCWAPFVGETSKATWISVIWHMDKHHTFFHLFIHLTNMYWDSAVPGTILNMVDRVGSQTAKLEGKDFQNESLIRKATCWTINPVWYSLCKNNLP